jgi:hypothetical protein
MGTDFWRSVDAVGTSSRCWKLAATASTLDSTLVAGFRIMDAADTMGTSSRRDIDAVGTSSRRVSEV